jgi:hypothetical protein
MITATKAAARANNFVALHNVGPADFKAQRKGALLRQYGFAQDRSRMMTFGRALVSAIPIEFAKTRVFLANCT